MNENTAALPTVTLGRGAALHAGYVLESGRLTGSLCNPYAWQSAKVRVVADAAPTCTRCAKATDRAAESARYLAAAKAAGRY